MKLERETILIPMMNGEKVAQEVQSFTCGGFHMSVRKISARLCYILHRGSGLKVTAEHTGDPQEAAEGFCDAVAVGAYNLTSMGEAVRSVPCLNARYAAELTPAGEQHVIPGCERNASPKASQLDLFG